MRTTVSAGGPPARPKRRSTSDSLRAKSRHDVLLIERLEDRLQMAADLLAGEDAFGLLSTHGACNCPICTGQGIDQIGLPAEIQTGQLSQAPLTSLPQLHSNASATAKLFLDFDGHFEASWGSRTNVTTPAFDQDGDATTFSAGELAAINEIWARIAEDYAPFNIDVTTVDPGTQANRVGATIAIGGSYTDWYGSSAGGVAYVGGFYNLSPNVGYVFANNLSGNAKYIAEAAAHEAGHLFGLQHQATWNGSQLGSEYSYGSGDWAPLMGVGYNASRTTWYNGPTSAGPAAYQDDMAIISGSNNGFGYRTDDYGSTTPTASSLPTIGSSVNFSGLIGQASDVDMWSFTTTGGSVTFQLTGAQYGTNLDGILEIRNSTGTTVVIDSPSNSYGASLSTTLTAGTYYLVARSVGDYGDAGQYTITGSLPAAVTAPEINLTDGGSSVADGGTINFGSTSLGTAVTKTITVTNQGSDVLTLTSLNAGSLPAGFTLVSNLVTTTLNPGSSTTFVVRLNATSAGTLGGTIQLFSNDSDEGTYDLTLSGTVTAPEIAIAISGAGVADGQTVNFGSTVQGASVSRTFTVTNTGTATLSLTSLNAGSLPAGFTLVSNIDSTSLAAGQSTSFTIRLNATAAGSFSGSIQLLNNDSDENPYDITLTGSVAAPEIAVDLSGSNLTTGQTVNLGTTTVGQVVSRTFTVTNTGTATLTLTSLNSANLPAGFTLVSNISTNSLAGGQSTTFSLQLNASAVGTFSTSLQLFSNDADESPFVLTVSGVVQAPEVGFALAGVNFASGQTVDFGSTTLGGSVTRTITISNSGSSDLHLTAINTGTLPAGFTVTTPFATTVAAGQSTSFTVQFSSLSAGTFGGAIVVASDDADEGSYTVNLQGVANAPTPPHLAVSVAGQNLNLGSTIDFGATVTGSSLDRTITIHNDGQSVLTLTPLNPNSLPAGYTIFQNLSQTSLAAGESTSFIVRLTAQTAGTYGGQFSLLSNDGSGPFTFNLTAGVVDPVPPLVQIADDGNAGAAQTGTWQKTSGKGYGADTRTAAKGSGSAVYSWTFTNLPAGQYRIYATWTSASTNASNAPYSFFDGTTKLATVAVSQRVAPSGLSVSGANWRLLTTVVSSSGQLTVRLTNAANGKVVADAIRIERVIPVLPPTAQLQLLYNNAHLAPGVSSVDFGSPDLGQPQLRTFTVTNQGTGSLALRPIDPTTLPPGFSLVEDLGTTFLTPGETTTFTVQLDADLAGTHSGTLSILDDDTGLSAFNFQISGTVYDPTAPVTRVLDDGSPGYSQAGTWKRVTGGNAGDQLTAVAGKGAITATWNFSSLANGEYRVLAAWKASATNASNAPYSLLNGSQLVSTAKLNQRVAPNDVWDGVWFETIGTVTVTNHQLTVKLTNAANGTVVADAIRIEKILNANISLPELTVASASADLPSADTTSLSAAFATPFDAGPTLTSQSFGLPQLLSSTSSTFSRLSDTTDNTTSLEDQLLADAHDLLTLARSASARTSASPTTGLTLHDQALASILAELHEPWDA